MRHHLGDCFAATGAIARTATNVRNGGTGPLAGLFHVLTLVLVLLFLAPLAEYVPLAALAAVLFVVAWNMSEVRHFAGMVRRAPRADVAVLLITFLLTIFSDLVLAVNVGVILAMFQFLRRMSTAVDVSPLEGAELDVALERRQWSRLPPGVMVYSIDGPFFFGAVDTFERSLAQTHTDPRRLVLVLRRVPFIDITGIQSLEEALRDLQRRGVDVILCGANPRVKAKLGKAGLLDLVGGLYFLADRPGAPDARGALQQVVPLTSYPGREAEPSFSPDGSQVAFTWNGDTRSNRDVYVTVIGAERPLRLTSDPAVDGSPAWSPDGARIVFLREGPGGGSQVRLVSPTGGAERPLAEVAASPEYGLAWSPDGRRLAAVDRSSPETPLRIVLLDDETGMKHPLTSPGSIAGRGDARPSSLRTAAPWPSRGAWRPAPTSSASCPRPEAADSSSSRRPRWLMRSVFANSMFENKQVPGLNR